MASRRPSIPAALLRPLSPVAFAAVLVALYQVMRLLSTGLADSLPSPTAILSAFVRALGWSETWHALGDTTFQWAAGLAITTVIAVPLGLAIGSIGVLDRAFNGTVEFLRPVPAPALIPLAILMFGLGHRMTLFLVVFGGLWPLLVHVIDGARSIDPLLRDAMRSYRVPWRTRVLTLLLPSAAPSIATGLRLASSVVLILAITANVTAGSPGLGFQMTLYESGGHNDVLYALILLTGIVGSLAGWLIHRSTQWAMPWAGYQSVVAKAPLGRLRPAWLGPLLAVATPLALIGLWQWYAGVSTSFVIVGPREILQALVDHWRSPGGLDDVRASVVRVGLGFGMAALVGIVGGVLLGMSRRLEHAAMPTMDFMRSLPATAVIPLAITTLGLGNTMQVAVIAFGALWPVLLNTASGVAELHPLRRDVARAYRLSAGSWIGLVVLPAALPRVLTGLRTSLAVSIIVLTVSEMLGSTNGLGHFVLATQRNFDMTGMWVGIVAIALLGLISSVLFVLVERIVGRRYE